MPVNWTASGASPVIGSALAVTSGAALFAAPLPSAVKWLRLKSPSPPPALGFTNTRNSSCVPSGGVGRSIVTLAQFCQPPVRRDRHRAGQRAGRRVETGLDRAAGAAGGDAEADAGQLLEVHRRVRDVVAVLDEADVLAAAGVGRGLRLHAGRRRRCWRRSRPVVVEELGLLGLGLQDQVVLARQRVGRALRVVRVGRDDRREDVRVRAVAGVGRRPERARSSPVCWPRPCAWSSCPSCQLSVTRLQSIGPSSGSVTVISYGTMSPNAANWPSSGTVIVTVGRVLPAVIGIVSKPVWPSRVGDGQRGVERARRGVGVSRVRVGRVGRAVAVEVPRVGQRRAVGVDAIRRSRTAR